MNPPMTQAPSIKEALEKMSRALKELQAYVWGECPSLLDEDRGGNARLDIDIDEALELAEAALATLQPSGERREAIARHNQELALGFCKASFQKRFSLSDSRTKEYAACIADVLDLATDFASGLVQDEAGWRDISTAPKDGTRFLWSCGDDKMSVIHWPEYELCFEGGYWMPLPAPPIRSARDGGAES